MSEHSLAYDRGDQVEQRGTTVYRPPSHDPGRDYPVIYCADGQGVGGCAQVIDPLITSGQINPVLVLGNSGRYEGDPDQPRQSGLDRRTVEYFYGVSDYMENAHEQAYEMHEQFVLDVVLPWAEQTLGASPDRAWRSVTRIGHSFCCHMGR